MFISGSVKATENPIFLETVWKLNFIRGVSRNASSFHSIGDHQGDLLDKPFHFITQKNMFYFQKVDHMEEKFQEIVDTNFFND